MANPRTDVEILLFVYEWFLGATLNDNMLPHWRSALEVVHQKQHMKAMPRIEELRNAASVQTK